MASLAAAESSEFRNLMHALDALDEDELDEEPNYKENEEGDEDDELRQELLDFLLDSRRATEMDVAGMDEEDEDEETEILDGAESDPAALVRSKCKRKCGWEKIRICRPGCKKVRGRCPPKCLLQRRFWRCKIVCPPVVTSTQKPTSTTPKSTITSSARPSSTTSRISTTVLPTSRISTTIAGSTGAPTTQRSTTPA